MRTRFAVVTVAAMLSTSLACRSAKDNNPSRDIRNAAPMTETVRDARINMGEPAPKPVEKVPMPDAETHKTDVLKATPKIKMLGPGNEDIVIPKPTGRWPFRGSK